ncbi:hypothetical protein SAMN05880582_101980 [Rhizobium sp. RU20A]|uniref:hypothetical protein n=1 Tax=Rhizobium sp. RU20A TaxID=1907412 RepID=UPI000955D8BF|nr:hypothetical protein [Rhizobium sp. RU20A]SIQ16800.1 hypothetical protein SAMN05880582_101980 [Rhizobium sp. RU20A]
MHTIACEAPKPPSLLADMVTRLKTAWRQRDRRRELKQALQQIEALPPYLQHDIGWPEMRETRLARHAAGRRHYDQ